MTDRLIAVPRRDAFANDPAEIDGQGGVGVINRLILADETAQFGRKPPRARFLRGIGELLARTHGQRRACGQQKPPAIDYEVILPDGSHAFSRACALSIDDDRFLFCCRDITRETQLKK